VANLIDVGAHGFADGSDRVDERNLHGEKSVGGVLDQLRALGGSDDDGSGNGSTVGLRNGVRALVITAAGERSVDFAENLGGALGVTADDDAVGKKEVGNGGAFPQELGIRSDVEGRGVGAVPQNDLANPLAGIDGHRTLLDDYFVSVDAAGDFASHRLDVRQVGLAAFGRRRAHGDEDDGTGAHGLLQIVGESEAASAVTAQQLGQEVFVDGDLAILEGGQFTFVVVDENDVMTKVGKAGASHQSYVSGTNHSDPHVSNSLD